MKNLNKIVTEKYAYIKNGVIFDVMSTKYPDSCAMEISSANAPYITVGEGDTNQTNVNYYFDAYIEDGDTYTPTNGFMKSVHAEKQADEKSITFQEYYRELCLEQITDTIINNYTLDYAYYRDNLGEFGIPLFMFAQDLRPVTGIDKINFTEDLYNSLKQQRIKELSLEAAEKVANKYNYHVTDDAKQCFNVENVEQ